MRSALIAVGLTVAGWLIGTGRLIAWAFENEIER